jgi:hypothetical protein
MSAFVRTGLIGAALVAFVSGVSVAQGAVADFDNHLQSSATDLIVLAGHRNEGTRNDGNLHRGQSDPQERDRDRDDDGSGQRAGDFGQVSGSGQKESNNNAFNNRVEPNINSRATESSDSNNTGTLFDRDRTLFGSPSMF